MTPADLVRAYNALIAEAATINTDTIRGKRAAIALVRRAAALPPLPVADVPEVGELWQRIGSDPAEEEPVVIDYATHLIQFGGFRPLPLTQFLQRYARVRPAPEAGE